MKIYLCYDPYCDYEMSTDDYDEAIEFCKLNACRCVDCFGRVICDYSNKEGIDD